MCAVSDHLASISLFDSDRWMECLEHFTGWTDTSPDSEKTLRSLVSQLKLRPLSEPGDVDSPLLRSQIDEQYLRAMASARAQMAGNGSENERRTGKDTSNKTTHQTPEVKSKKNGAAQHSSVRLSSLTQFSPTRIILHDLNIFLFCLLGPTSHVSSSKWRFLGVSWTCRSQWRPLTS